MLFLNNTPSCWLVKGQGEKSADKKVFFLFCEHAFLLFRSEIALDFPFVIVAVVSTSPF
jgi:hypothetical protein